MSQVSPRKIVRIADGNADIPGYIQNDVSIIAMDHEGRLYSQYKNQPEQEGYKVKCLNFVSPEKGNCYNPFQYIRSIEDIEALVSTIIARDTSEDKKDKALRSKYPFLNSFNLPFSWKRLEDLFLTAVFSYIFLHMPVEQRKLKNILPLIRNCARDSADAATGINPFDKLREQCPNSYALAKYIEFREASRNIFGDYYESILISCVMRLIIFDSVIYTNVASVTDKDDLKIEDFADDKFAIFVVIPSKEDVDNIYDIVSDMLFCQITRCIDRYF